MSESQDPVTTMFDLQRTALRQTRHLFRQGLALQRAANRMALNGLRGQEMLGRQGTEMARVATRTTMRSMEVMVGGDGQEARYRALDEQFDQFERMHAQFFETVERELERSIDSFDELSEEYLQAVDEGTQQLQRGLQAQAEMVEVPIQAQSTTGPASPEQASERQLEDLAGIGSTYASRLREAGIETPGDLARADPETVTEAADVSTDEAEEWIRQAGR